MVVSIAEIGETPLKVLDKEIQPPAVYATFKEGNKRFGCPGCKFSAFEQDDVKEHMVDSHRARRGKFDWRCPLKPHCEAKLFKTKEEVYVHVFNSHYCGVCNRCFEPPCTQGHHRAQ